MQGPSLLDLLSPKLLIASSVGLFGCHFEFATLSETTTSFTPSCASILQEGLYAYVFLCPERYMSFLRRVYMTLFSFNTIIFYLCGACMSLLTLPCVPHFIWVGFTCMHFSLIGLWFIVLI